MSSATLDVRRDEGLGSRSSDYIETTWLSREMYCAFSFIVWSVLTWPYYVNGEPIIWEYAPNSLYLLDASVTIVAAMSMMTILLIFFKCYDVPSCGVTRKMKGSLLMTAALIHVIGTSLLINKYCAQYDLKYVWQCSCIISAFNFGYVASTLVYYSLAVFGVKQFASGETKYREFRIIFLSCLVLMSNILILAKEFDLHSGSSKTYNGLKAGLVMVCIAAISSLICVARKWFHDGNKLVYYSVCLFFFVGGLVSFAYSFPTLETNGANIYVKLSAIGFGWLQWSVDSLIAVEIYGMVKALPQMYTPIE